MDRCLVVVAVLLMVASVEVASQYISQEENRNEWNITSFPDPRSQIEEERMRCQRHTVSSVCNPNKIITKTDADAIDNMIETVYRETRCSCSDCLKHQHGYGIRVAIVNSFEKFKKNTVLTQKQLLQEAKMFAYLLSQKWRMEAACNETLLILYARKDHVLFTLTRSTARMRLGDNDISRISLAVRSYFDKPSTIGNGILDMIRRYRLIFDGKHQEAFQPIPGKRT